MTLTAPDQRITGRAHLSFLVVDQVGSTTQISTLGDERAAQIRLEMFDLISEPVERFGGTVFHYTGDGLMATFADAADAVWAGVAMQQAVAVGAADRVAGEEIVLRIGIHTGEPIVTADGHFVGVAVHVAARLCDVAASGDLVVSPDVCEEAGDAFPFEPVGDRQMKGLPAPIAVHRVVLDQLHPPRPPLRRDRHEAAGRPATARFDVFEPSPLVRRTIEQVEDGPVVGRAGERRALADALDAAGDGERRLVVLAAEAGGGKSTLIGELLQRARGRDEAVALLGRCRPGSDRPFGAVIGALEPLVAQVPEPVLTENFARYGDTLATLLPDLGRRLGLDAVPAAPDELSRSRLFEAVVDLLVLVAEQRTVVLVVEDLHWASPPTLELLVHLARSSSIRRTLVVGSYRPDGLDANPTLRDALARLDAQTALETVAVGPLDVADVEELLEARAVPLDGDVRARVAQRLHAETGGSAFFITELLAGLDHEQLVADELPVPASIRDMVAARVDGLPAAAREVAVAASVAGLSVDVDLLAELVDRPEGEFLDGIDHLLAAGVVVEVHDATTGTDHLEFAHALFASSVRSELSALRRRRLHRRLVDVLAVRSPGARAREASTLLFHIEQANATDRLDVALDVAAAGIERDMGNLAYENAVELARTAIRLLDQWGEPGDARTAGLHLQLGQCLNALGRIEDAIAEFVTVVAIDDRTETLAEVALAWGGTSLPSTPPLDPGAIQLIETALSRADLDRTTRALLLARLAERRHTDLPDAERTALLDEADELLGDDWRHHAQVAVSRLRTLHGPAHAADNLELVDAVDRVAHATGDDLLTMYAAHFRATYLMVVGAVDAAEAATEAADRIARRLRQPELLRMRLQFQAMLRGLRGDYAGAEMVRAELLEVLETGQHSQRTLIHGTVAVPWMWLQGHADVLAPLMVSFAPKYNHVFGAWMWADAGDLEQARSHLDQVEPVEEIVADQSYSFWQAVAGISIAATRLGDADLARRTHEALAPHAGQLMMAGTVGCFGSSHHFLAMTASTFSDHALADHHFAEALACHRRLGARPFVALTAAEWSNSLAGREPTVDVDRARLLAEGLDLAEELGLALVRRVAGV